jgi:RNA polymerase sigma-70 factor (ECF subfamily)
MTIHRWFRAGARIQGEVPSALMMSGMREATRTSVAEIHERHADFVWRSLQRLGVRSADLEDALQEVFIVVHRRLESFSESSRLTTWLFGICLRVASAHRNRAHVRRERTGADLEVFDGAGEPGPHGPEQALLESELRAELEELLDCLDPVKRATVVMFEIEGMSAPEIATLTDVAVNTVYSRLGTARVELAAAARRAQLRKSRGLRSGGGS